MQMLKLMGLAIDHYSSCPIFGASSLEHLTQTRTNSVLKLWDHEKIMNSRKRLSVLLFQQKQTKIINNIHF